MVELWKKSILAISESMGCSTRDAALWLMSEFRKEAAKMEEQEKLGLPVEMFGTMSYDPLKDPSHPMHGWRPE